MSFLFSKSKNSIIFVPEKYTPNLAAKFTAKRIVVCGIIYPIYPAT